MTDEYQLREREFRELLVSRTYADPGIVKPSQFKITELLDDYWFHEHLEDAIREEKDPQKVILQLQDDVLRLNARLEGEITLEKYRTWLSARKDAFAKFKVRGYKEHRQKLLTIDSGLGWDIVFFPVELEEHLCHDTNYHFLVNGPCGSDLSTIKRDGVVGNSDKEKPTYLKRISFCNGLCGEGGGYRITIDTKKLLESRTLFHDPEGLAFRPEIGNTFLVFGGIPLESILELSQPDF